MKEIRRIFPWIFLVCSFGVLCAFMILRFEYVLDSDLASELILAQQMSQEGRFVFTDSWYYPKSYQI